MGEPHFLCCLPIRWGAFVVAFLHLLFSGLQSLVYTVALVNLHRELHGQISQSAFTGVEVIVGLLDVFYVSLFFLALFGLIGVINRRIDWIRRFNRSLISVLIINLILGVLSLVLFAVDRDNLCQNITYNDSSTCNISKEAVMITSGIILGITLLIEGYGIWIVSDCIKYLEMRREANGLHPFALQNPRLMPLPTDEHHIPLTLGKEYKEEY